MDGNGELKLFVKLIFFFFFFFGGGGGGGDASGWRGQGGCERRSKVFVKIQKKNFFWGGVRVGWGSGRGGPIRGWGGGGGVAWFGVGG